MADSFRQFLNEIGKYPLLTAEQEIQLSRRIFAMQDLLLERDLEKEPLTKQEQRVVRSGRRAKEKLMNGNLRLVVNVARKYAPRIDGTILELPDLVQEGCIGLQRAVEKYDGTRGYKFSTYAYWWIRQSITRAIDMSSRVVRLPQNTIEKINRLCKWINDFEQEFHRRPTLQEMSEQAERPVEEIMLWFERAKQHRSLDMLCHDDGSPLLQQIPDPSSYADTENMAIKSANYEAINSALETLNDREYEIIQRYFLSSRTEALAHIGAEMNICRERTRQIKERALRKLRLKTQKNISPPG
jgi:RNA polymerase primary sigma factor